MLKFLCDEMLTGLGRWLRIAGYDTEMVVAGTSDADVIIQVRQSNRYFLTCDALLSKQLADYPQVILLDNSNIDSSVKSLNHALHIDWMNHAFHRCSFCNTVVELAPANKIRNLDIKLKPEQPIYYCSECDKLYWEGGHVKRMLRRLDEFQHK